MDYRLTKEDKDFLIKRISEILEADERIIFAYIFGSFISGNGFRDIDVAVFISGEDAHPLKAELEMEAKIEAATHLPVDVRIINNAPLSFVYNVLKHKSVIVDKDKSLRTDFEGLIFKKYFDYRHLREE